MKLLIYDKNCYYNFIRYDASPLSWVLTHGSSYSYATNNHMIMWESNNIFHEEDMNEVKEAFREQYNIFLTQIPYKDKRILTVSFRNEADEAEFILKMSSL